MHVNPLVFGTQWAGGPCGELSTDAEMGERTGPLTLSSCSEGPCLLVFHSCLGNRPLSGPLLFSYSHNS